VKKLCWAVVIQFSIVAAATAADPLFNSELIFPLQDKHVHSSSIVECPNGDLLACWYHGSGERRANDVVVQGARLKRGAGRWSRVFLMADTPGLPDCNPVMFIDNKKRLWLFWVAVRANRWERSILKYRVASDYEGEGPPKWTWQDVIVLDPGDKFAETLRAGFEKLSSGDVWGEYAPSFEQGVVAAAADPVKRQEGWMPRTHPRQLASGRMLLPLYSDGFVQCLMAISDDGGETWRASGPIVGIGASQPSVVQKKDGTLVTYHRNDGGPQRRALQSVSKDQGETWDIARPTDVPNPGSSLEAIALADGRWAMVFNDTERGRQRLAVALSDDEGKTWPAKRHLERAEGGSGGFAYPSVIQTRDGRIQATYTYSVEGGKSIKHVDLDPRWVQGR
jgi:predicted neuraminidase